MEKKQTFIISKTIFLYTSHSDKWKRTSKTLVIAHQNKHEQEKW